MATGKRRLRAVEADRLARYQRRRNPHERIVAFPCRGCGWWHIGHDELHRGSPRRPKPPLTKNLTPIRLPPMPTTATPTPIHLVDAYAEAGLLPAEESGLIWVMVRYDAAIATPSGGWLGAKFADDELCLTVIAHRGAIRSEARFSDNALGLAAFVAAAHALGAVA